MEKDLKNLCEDYTESKEEAQELYDKFLFLYSIRRSTPRKYTGLYMIFIMALAGLFSGVIWDKFGIDVVCFTLLMILVGIGAAIRYNQ